MLFSSLYALATYVVLGVGGALNLLELWLIVLYSPAEMRVYRKILVQILAVDVLTLIIGPLTQPVSDS